MKACGLRYSRAFSANTGGSSGVPNGADSGQLIPGLPTPSAKPKISVFYSNGITMANGQPGDWDTGFGDVPDGAYANKPDEGEWRSGTQFTGYNNVPYFIGSYASAVDLGLSTYFAPNRQVPSPGMLGSLLTRGRSLNGQWQTLLLNPNPAAGSAHPALVSGQPPDCLWLDLFTMPIVEPYAISEPFSNAGKVNMNYQIVPFTYITRNTALQAVFASNRVSAIHNGFAATYKSALVNKSIRHTINAGETLKQFDRRFADNAIFRSASEICTLDLYPVVGTRNVPSGAGDQPTYSASGSGIKTWWADRLLTGDNLREQPYTTMYQNLTTQSNTYTIHVWAQAIQKPPGSPVDEMTSRDAVTGEYRVAYAIERFIDPNNPALPDFALAASANTSGFYQFRVNNTKQFQP